MSSVELIAAPGMRTKILWRLAPGVVAWILFLAIQQPHVLRIEWGRAVLLFAALVVVRLALPLLGADAAREPLLAAARWLQFPAACSLAFSLAFEPGASAVVLALPWLLVASCIAVQGLVRLARRQGDGVIAFGMAYLAVGGVWTLCDRAAWAPLGFDREIGLLTAIHFHFAGFALPLLASLAARELDTRDARITAWATVIAVPFLAVGIAAAHLGAPSIIETFSASIMASAALAVAWQYGRLVASPGVPFYPRYFWTLGALVLAGAMIPALLYGARGFLPIPWLDIPLMRAIHGSANAFGFTLPALLAWHWKHPR